MSQGILILFSIILFWTYHTSYTNFDLVHSFTGNSFKIDFGAPEVSKSSPSDRRSGVKRNGILFPSFSLLTVGYRSSLPTSLHYFSPRWSNNLFAGGELPLLTVGNYGTFSLLTVGYTDNFKYGAGGKIFPTQCWEHCLFQIWRRREFFSLLTVGNTDIFKFGAGGEGVTWPGKWRG